MALTYEPIATTTIASNTPNITFSSIPSTYTDLRVVLVGTTATNGNRAEMRFNSDSANNYSEIGLKGDGSTAVGNSGTNRPQIVIGDAAQITTSPVFITVDIFSYSGSKYKVSLITTSMDNNNAAPTPSAVIRRVATWRTTSAINSILLMSNDNWAVGTTATLYGIKAA
jgi:hypothetical protein